MIERIFTWLLVGGLALGTCMTIAALFFGSWLFVIGMSIMSLTALVALVLIWFLPAENKQPNPPIRDISDE